MRTLEKVFVALAVFARIGEVYVVTALKTAEPDVAKSSTKDYDPKKDALLPGQDVGEQVATSDEFIRLMQQEKVITKSNLRASPIFVPKLEKPISELSINERADAMQTVGASASQAAVELRSLELSDYPIFEAIVGPGLENIDKAFETISDLVGFVRSLSKDSENHAEEEEIKNLAQSSGVHQPRRILKEENTRDTRDGAGEQKWHKNRRRFLDGKFSEFHGGHGAQSHASFASDIQSAFQNGNINDAYNILNGGHAHMHHRRRTSAHGHGRQLSKTEQCQQLVFCAKRMSVYDMFVFFFSDDIDPNQGTVDENIKTFDEGGIKNFNNKYDLISAHAQRMAAFDDFSDQECRGLLSRFHRTLEYGSGSVPIYEGALVSQVCLAEGTTVHVKVDEIFETLLGLKGNSLTNDEVEALMDYFDSGSFKDDFMPMVMEPFKCARDLYKSDDRKNYNADELFVFCKNINTCESEYDFLFPYKMSLSRDRHGKPKNNHDRKFESVRLIDLEQRVSSCVQPFLDDARKEFRSMNKSYNKKKEIEKVKKNMKFLSNKKKAKKKKKKKNAERKEVRVEKKRNITIDVVRSEFDCYIDHYFTPIRESLELVFGQRSSPGFICGLKEAVINDSKQIPGSCCLDAPFELSNDNWGYAYKCENVCRNKGPYLAGISLEACDAQGGTWCPSLADCTVLQTCIEDLIVLAQSENQKAFGIYLSDAPNITSPTNAFQCGRTREYFGFDKLFINDDVICENIEQLKGSDDFLFLEEFFNQGSKGPGAGGGGGCTGGSNVGVACLDLTPPDTSTTDSAPVQNGKAWRSTNYALEKALDFTAFMTETTDSVECPCDPTCTVANICKAVKATVKLNFGHIHFMISLAHDISVQTYGEMADVDNIGPLSVIENSAPIFDNMRKTGDYLQERFTVLEQSFCISHDQDSTDGHITTCAIFDEVLSILDVILCRPVKTLLPGHGCDGLDNDCEGNHQPDNCEEDIYNPTIDFSKVVEFCGDKHVFATSDDAENCVKTHVSAKDDCYPVTTTFQALVAADNLSKCGSIYEIKVTAKEDMCNKTTIGSFSVLVDTSILSPSCEFSQGLYVPPSLDISKAEELCGGKVFFNNVTEAEACVGEKSVVKDDCRAVSLSTFPNLVTDKTLSKYTTTYAITVTASVIGCTHPDSTGSKKVLVLIDPNVASPSCEFSQGPDVKPALDVSRAIELCAGKFFPTIQNAEDCVRMHSKAEDSASSCRPVVIFVESKEGANTCEYYITVTANVKDCDQDEFKMVSKPITVFIDNEAPRPKCSFAVSPVKHSDRGELKNPDFLYSIAENCGGALSVVIESFSNELENKVMARHYQQPKDSKNNSKVGVYYSSRTCGDLNNGFCITDPVEQGRRFYMNRVIATDEAGITGTSECFVEVIKQNKSPSGPDPPGNSIQLFSIARSSGEGYSPDGL